MFLPSPLPQALDGTEDIMVWKNTDTNNCELKSDVKVLDFNVKTFEEYLNYFQSCFPFHIHVGVNFLNDQNKPRNDLI